MLVIKGLTGELPRVHLVSILFLKAMTIDSSLNYHLLPSTYINICS